MTKEQFHEWKNSPVTQEIFAEIHARREGYKEHIAQGGSLESEVTTAMLVGRMQGLNEILTADFRDEDESDD